MAFTLLYLAVAVRHGMLLSEMSRIGSQVGRTYTAILERERE